MRDLVELYFKDRSIVNHHISSFNDFLPTLDNPNSRMQKIVDNLRVSAEDMDRGIIRLDPDKTDGRIIEIRVGRKRDDRGNIDQGAKPTIKVKLPENREADGSTPLPHSDGGPASERELSITNLPGLHNNGGRNREGAREGRPHRRPAHHGQVARSAPSTRRTWRRSGSSTRRSTGACSSRRARTPWTPVDTSSSEGRSACSSPWRTWHRTGSWSRPTSATAPSWRSPRCSPRRKGTAPSHWSRRSVTVCSWSPFRPPLGRSHWSP